MPTIFSSFDEIWRSDNFGTYLQSPAAQRSSRSRSNFHALPFGRLWYGKPNAISNAVDYAKFYSRPHDAVIRVYNEAGNVVETHEPTAPATACQLNTNIIKFPQP